MEKVLGARHLQCGAGVLAVQYLVQCEGDDLDTKRRWESSWVGPAALTADLRTEVREIERARIGWVLGENPASGCERCRVRGAGWEEQQAAAKAKGEADREADARAKGVVLRRMPRVEAMRAGEEARRASGAEEAGADSERPMEQDSSEDDDEAGEEEERSTRGAVVKAEDGERP